VFWLTEFAPDSLPETIPAADVRARAFASFEFFSRLEALSPAAKSSLEAAIEAATTWAATTPPILALPEADRAAKRDEALKPVTGVTNWTTKTLLPGLRGGRGPRPLQAPYALRHLPTSSTTSEEILDACSARGAGRAAERTRGLPRPRRRQGGGRHVVTLLQARSRWRRTRRTAPVSAVCLRRSAESARRSGHCSSCRTLPHGIERVASKGIRRVLLSWPVGSETCLSAPTAGDVVVKSSRLLPTTLLERRSPFEFYYFETVRVVRLLADGAEPHGTAQVGCLRESHPSSGVSTTLNAALGFEHARHAPGRRIRWM
jgi:hypothetical protein